MKKERGLKKKTGQKLKPEQREGDVIRYKKGGNSGTFKLNSAQEKEGVEDPRSIKDDKEEGGKTYCRDKKL